VSPQAAAAQGVPALLRIRPVSFEEACGGIALARIDREYRRSAYKSTWLSRLTRKLIEPSKNGRAVKSQITSCRAYARNSSDN